MPKQRIRLVSPILAIIVLVVIKMRKVFDIIKQCQEIFIIVEPLIKLFITRRGKLYFNKQNLTLLIRWDIQDTIQFQ